MVISGCWLGRGHADLNVLIPTEFLKDNTLQAARGWWKVRQEIKTRYESKIEVTGSHSICLGI